MRSVRKFWYVRVLWGRLCEVCLFGCCRILSVFSMTSCSFKYWKFRGLFWFARIFEYWKEGRWWLILIWISLVKPCVILLIWVLGTVALLNLKVSLGTLSVLSETIAILDWVFSWSKLSVFVLILTILMRTKIWVELFSKIRLSWKMKFLFMKFWLVPFSGTVHYGVSFRAAKFAETCEVSIHSKILRG